MENLLGFIPYENINEILNWVSDIDYVHFLFSSKQFYEDTNLMRPIQNFYSWNKIKSVLHRYEFTKILLNESNSENIMLPNSVVEIDLGDEFNGDIINLQLLPKLKKIIIGIRFTNLEFINKIPTHLENYRELCTTIIPNIWTNIYYAKEFNRINYPLLKSLPYFDYVMIHPKLIRKNTNILLEGLNKNIIDDKWLNKITQIITKINNIPSIWPVCKKLKKSKRISIRQLMEQLRYYDQYNIIFDIFGKSDNYYKLIRKRNSDELVDFIFKHQDLVKQFILDFQSIRIGGSLVLKTLYDRVMQKYNIGKTVLEYYQWTQSQWQLKKENPDLVTGYTYAPSSSESSSSESSSSNSFDFSNNSDTSSESSASSQSY